MKEGSVLFNNALNTCSCEMLDQYPHSSPKKIYLRILFGEVISFNEGCLIYCFVLLNISWNIYILEYCLEKSAVSMKVV